VSSLRRRRALSLGGLREIEEGIASLVILPDLEVEVRAVALPSVTNQGDGLPLTHPLMVLCDPLLEMGIHGRKLIGMFQDQDVPIAPKLPPINDLACSGCHNLGVLSRCGRRRRNSKPRELAI
jgi:hypothetical protein